MTRRWRPVFAAVMAAFLAAGCSGGGSGVKPGEAPARAVGNNLAGEACRAMPAADAPADPGARAPLNILCGAGGDVAGVVHAAALPRDVAAAGPARRGGIERAAQQSSASLDLAARMTCRPGHWVSAEGSEALIAACTLTDGNWPQIVLTAAVGTTLFQAEGAPALLPVFATVIGAESGAPFTLGAAAGSIEQLEKLLGSKLPLFGTNDLGAYNELMQTARLYNSGRNSREAEAADRRALDIQVRIFGATSPGASQALMALALEVSNQGRFEEAAGLFRRAEQIVERSPDVLDRARLASYQALDAANQDHYGEALAYARQATALRRTRLDAVASPLGDAGSTGSQNFARGELAHSLGIEAAMAERLDDLPSAEAAASEALQIIAETPDLPQWWRPNALSMIGEINAREGRFTAAERNDLDALAFRQKLFGDTVPTALSYLVLGRLYADEEQLADSVRAFRSAFAILRKDRTSRSGIAFDQLAPFLKVAAALAERDPQQRPALEADMFEAIQLTGAGVDDQTIARASARLAAADPQVADLVRQEQEAQRRSDAARLALADETAKPDEQRGAIKEAALAQEVQVASGQTDALLQQLQAVFPAYGKLANPGAVELVELRRLLKGDEALITFSIGREATYGVLVRADRLVVRRLDLTNADLASSVGELRRAFETGLGVLPEFDLRDAYALHQQLLAPFADGLTGIDHLVVVAGGPLASLPLGLLVTAPPVPGHERDYGHAAFLVRQLALSEVPSVRAFVSLRGAAAQRLEPAKSFLGFGAPAFSGAPPKAGGSGPRVSALAALAGQCRDDGPIPPELLRALAPLPETAGEVTTIARMLGADAGAVHLGADASETTLRGLPLDQYRVLYFATHGLLPGELHCQAEPGLALSPPAVPATSKAADGLLDATEIAALKLNADLVVLSACNTASGGGRFGGEALSGLAEAFFYAGAHTLLASHWEVPSTATVRLMTGLFERLGPDRSRGIAESMRQSQLALIDQPATAHPFFWAAFSVIGDGGAPSPTTAVAAAPN